MEVGSAGRWVVPNPFGILCAQGTATLRVPQGCVRTASEPARLRTHRSAVVIQRFIEWEPAINRALDVRRSGESVTP